MPNRPVDGPAVRVSGGEVGEAREGASIAFDRAAEFYDRTRSLSELAMEEVLAFLQGELRGRASTLEIGVGTGRLAVPLHLGGASMVGVDLSPAMLGKLVDKIRDVSLRLAVADATRLPFRSRSFDSVIAAHVLHLIPAWRTAVREIVRVLRPGGVILLELGGWGVQWMRELHERFCLTLGVPQYVGVSNREEVRMALESLGVRLRRTRVLHDRRSDSIGNQLGRMEEGVYSFTWAVPEEARRRTVRELRSWAEERFGSLEESRRFEARMVWGIFDVPQRDPR
jgi:ubiquinone/menaquinone biosynthesis C-methylase UbiE